MQRAFFQKHLDPRQLRLRAQIISHEIAAPPGKQLGYMENKELTELDRQLIMTSRALLAASKVTLEQVGRGPNKAMEMMANMWLYNKEILKQLSEVHYTAEITDGVSKHFYYDIIAAALIMAAATEQVL